MGHPPIPAVEQLPYYQLLEENALVLFVEIKSGVIGSLSFPAVFCSFFFLILSHNI
jgi:hypothetical protein